MPFQDADGRSDRGDVREVAEYVGELAAELAALARGAGLVGAAAALDLARCAAEADVARLKAQPKAAPEDAA